MADSMKVYSPDLDKLIEGLRVSSEVGKFELDAGIIESAEEVTLTAKVFAAKHSKSIPGTIKMIPGNGEALITAGTEDKPLARLYELGNKGKNGGYDSRAKNDKGRLVFRHEVFGDEEEWVLQRRYPFLRRAVYANRRITGEIMNHALERALEPLGLEWKTD
jgi:hypothetical protein